jgi:hypothetical protein
MADCLRGSNAPTSKLGPLLIDYSQAFGNLVELAASSAVELGERHGYPIEFDQYGVAALDRIIADLWRDGWTFQSPLFDAYVKAIGSVLACTILKYGNSIIAFRAKDNFNNFSVYVSTSQTEYFPFHRANKSLATPNSGTVSDYYTAFIADADKR